MDINFIKPNHKRDLSPTTKTQSTPKRNATAVPIIPPKELYESVYTVAPSAALFTIVPPPGNDIENTTHVASTPLNMQQNQLLPLTSQDQEVAQDSDHDLPVPSTNSQCLEHDTTNIGSQAPQDSDQDLPVPLMELYNSDNCPEDDTSIRRKAEEVFQKLSITDHQAEAVEQATRLQSNSEVWKNQQQGRITASSFHDIFVRKDSTSPESLVGRLLGYNEVDLSLVP